MGLLDKIPMPGTGFDGVMQGTDWMQKLLMGPVEQRAKESEMKRLQEQEPLKMDLLRAQIQSMKALGNQRNAYAQSGGSQKGGSVGFKDILALKNQIKTESGVDDETANDLTNRALQGEDVGLGGISLALVDQITKRGSTAGLITQGVNAAQADAEVDTLSKIANEWNKPYGTTYMNMSPSQITDTFKNDEKSQTRLGEFIAAQQLQNEIAQIETRLAMGQPGISNTHDLMKLGLQTINASYPRLSQKAREVSQKRFVYALKQGLKSRQKVGVRASAASGSSGNNDNNNVTEWDVVDGKLVKKGE